MQPESSESTWVYEALAWLEVHKRQVLIGVGALLALAVAGHIYSWQRDRSELKAGGALLALRALPASAEDDTAAPAADFLKVAKEHSSSSAAERAVLLAAGTLYGENKYTEAQALFEKFLAEHGDSPLAGIAALGVASSLDALDKRDEALAAYQNLLTRYPDDSGVLRAKLAMGGLYLAKNQPDQALRLYEEVGRAGAFDKLGTEARARKERLLLQFPQLAKPDKLSAPAPSAAGAPGPQVKATNAAKAAAPAPKK